MYNTTIIKCALVGVFEDRVTARVTEKWEINLATSYMYIYT